MFVLVLIVIILVLIFILPRTVQNTKVLEEDGYIEFEAEDKEAQEFIKTNNYKVYSKKGNLYAVNKTGKTQKLSGWTTYK
jgi:cell division protein FtsI/penicillin-binding protein 2